LVSTLIVTCSNDTSSHKQLFRAPGLIGFQCIGFISTLAAGTSDFLLFLSPPIGGGAITPELGIKFEASSPFVADTTMGIDAIIGTGT